MTIISDRHLSQRLERAEARANADFVETRAEFSPESEACWIDVAGVYAMFDGPESPCTQTFGLGLFDDIGDHVLQALERFFVERNAPVFHEVSPMADVGVLQLLNDRGYRPVEMSNILYKNLDDGNDGNDTRKSKVSTRLITAAEADTWARISSAGWATEAEELADFMYGFGQITTRCAGSYPYLAEIGGEPVATGMLFIYEDTCILAGASTIPEGRNQGAQTALLADRLHFASERGCKLAIMGAAPGSQSQRNAQKNGFDIAYTRTKWQLVL